VRHGGHSLVYCASALRRAKVSWGASWRGRRYVRGIVGHLAMGEEGTGRADLSVSQGKETSIRKPSVRRAPRLRKWPQMATVRFHASNSWCMPGTIRERNCRHISYCNIRQGDSNLECRWRSFAEISYCKLDRLDLVRLRDSRIDSRWVPHG
jgi:hypothetical protein